MILNSLSTLTSFGLLWFMVPFRNLKDEYFDSKRLYPQKCLNTDQTGSKEEMVKMKMRTINTERSSPANLFRPSPCCIACISYYQAISFTSETHFVKLLLSLLFMLSSPT